MIREVQIRNAASYDGQGQTLSDLKKVNFIYGSNGSGKTTISRVIQGRADWTDCAVTWNGPELERYVYNRDFVDANFSQTIKGIFTLGEESTELAQEIESTSSELQKVQAKISNLETKLNGDDTTSGKILEREQLDSEFNDSAWTYKKKYEDVFRDALSGTMGRKTDFASRLRKEAQNRAEVALKSKDDLLKRAASVYGNELIKYDLLQAPNPDAILELEKVPELSKKVIGNDDIDIAAMIEKLGNSDWVREGLAFHEVNGNVCPFCQQETSELFAKSLTEYFDETYLADLDELKKIEKAYGNYAQEILDAIQTIFQAESLFIDAALFKAQSDLVAERLETNVRKLGDKLSEPSRSVTLDALKGVLDELIAHIETANKNATEHNDLVDNSSEERKRLQTDVWRFIVEDAAAILDSHNQRASAVEKAIEGLRSGLEECEKKYAELAARLAELEKRGTSINSSIAEINQTLSSFNFNGFRLEQSETAGYYKIVRPDGQDVEQSLSEGEKTFVTFLYFFQLLRGSQSQSGVTTPRVAVFDDPVSSLDSEVLFIVSTLIKSVIASIAEGGPVKQVILLTHNIYFFKEVSFKSSKQVKAEGAPKNKYSYWMVTKRSEISEIERHEESPIKSAYQMLWDEVKRDDCSRHSIRNTLRRILEYYFTTIGDKSLDDLPKNFVGVEQSICRSLISWVHEGSHFTDDDFTVVPSMETIERQKAVFKRIFEVTNHLSHYEMMMGKDLENLEIEEVAPQ